MKERIIYLNYNVEKSFLSQTVEQLSELEQESNDDIGIVISSFGGCVWTMFAVMDALERSPCNISTLAISKCMSAGAFLLVCAGTKGKRFVFPNTCIMLHEPRGFADVSGRGGMASIDDLREKIVVKLMAATTMTRGEILALIDRDNYIYPQEAMELGLIDGIVGTDRGLDL